MTPIRMWQLRYVVATAFMWTFSFTLVGAQTVLIDFGNDASFRGLSVPNPDANGKNWNNLRTGVFYQNLVDVQNAPTTIDFGFSTPVATDSYNGPAGPTSEDTLPFDVQLTDIDSGALGEMGGAPEAAFDYVAGPDMPGNNQVRFEIQQLDPAKKYDLSFFGSHKFSTDDTTIYSVYTDNTYTTSIGTASLNVQSPGSPWLHNRDTIATITNLSPQADNILYVQFIGSNGSLGYLNELRIVGNTVALPGDYNGDGKVNAADYVVWRNDPASHGGNPAGYNAWRANFGAGSAAGIGSGATVPEPAAVVIILAAITSCWSCARMRPW